MQCRHQRPPALPDSIVKFHDAGIKPPKGGWHFAIAGQTFTGNNESEVASKLKRWRTNNATFVSDLDIERELWAYWCGRQPQRCYAGLPAKSHVERALKPAEVTKELQGPPIWTFLNTLAVAWEPSLHPLFLHLCDSISIILVCPLCIAEWQRILRDNRPNDLSTRLEVCQWVNDAHNEVNARAGKPAYPYDAMVAHWGAPMP